MSAACRFKRPFVVVPCCVFPRKFPHRLLNKGTHEEVPVVSYEQVTPVCFLLYAVLSAAAHPLAPLLLQFLCYLQDMVRSAGGTPVLRFLGMQGMNAVVSCSEWGTPP